jgi:thiamine biosynthesis lipoprotein
MLEETHAVLGTKIRIATHADFPSVPEKIQQAFLEAQRIERTYSRFIADNELTRLNTTLNVWTHVTPELFQLLAFGKQLANETAGAFDLSVKGVLENWGYDATYSLGEERTTGATGHFELNITKQEVYLTAPIELGALGKGYALDQMKKICAELPDLFINAGGDIYARGGAKQPSWTTYLEHPRDPTQAIGELTITEGFFAGSSPRVRRWRDRHHLVDARTKLPASDMLATFVAAETGLLADGYATALFVVGYEQAKKIVQAKRLAAVLISPDDTVFTSKEFPGKLYQ